MRRIAARSVIAAAGLALLLAGVRVKAASGPRPLLLRNLRVAASAGESALPAAIVVSGDSIRFIGAEAQAVRLYPGAEILDLKGGVAYPGLTDSHGHLEGLGQFLEYADLRGAASEAECVARLRESAASLPPGTWVRGRGWDQNEWPGGAFPDARSLDAAFAGRPAVANRADGHSLWVSSEVLRRAGVSKDTKDPPGGRIVRRPDGRPSGVLVDAARELVWKIEPPPTADEVRRWFRTALKRCASLGLTEVGDASAYGDENTAFGADRIEVLRDMARAGELPIRVSATLGWKTPRAHEWRKKGPFEEGLLAVRAVKVYADGALGSRGAAMLAGYADDPNNRGLLVTPPEEIEKLAEECFRTGFQIWIHAIGDRACRVALDAIEAAERKVHPADPRPRIEHAQVVSASDLPRFASLGVIASIQPVFATSDMPWAEARLSRSRLAESYAWRSLAQAGARLCGGSDFPNDVMDPRVGIYAAVTRQTVEGGPPGGWRPEEDLSRAEAIALYTGGAAYASFEEGRRGSLGPERAADITVFDRDLATCPASEIPRAKVLLTLVAGKVAFQTP